MVYFSGQGSRIDTSEGPSDVLLGWELFVQKICERWGKNGPIGAEDGEQPLHSLLSRHSTTIIHIFHNCLGWPDMGIDGRLQATAEESSLQQQHMSCVSTRFTNLLDTISFRLLDYPVAAPYVRRFYYSYGVLSAHGRNMPVTTRHCRVLSAPHCGL